MNHDVCRRVERELRDEILKLQKALGPFAGVVFYDNGDVTYDYSHAKPEDYRRAYDILRR